MIIRGDLALGTGSTGPSRRMRSEDAARHVVADPRVVMAMTVF